MSWDKDIDEIKKRRKLAKQQGGKQAVKAHHEKGRLTIRERVETLLDKNSFDEVGEGAGVPEYDDDGKPKIFSPPISSSASGKLTGAK